MADKFKKGDAVSWKSHGGEAHGKVVKKLSHACGGSNYIETVWGRGYVLRDPDEQAEAA